LKFEYLALDFSMSDNKIDEKSTTELDTNQAADGLTLKRVQSSSSSAGLSNAHSSSDLTEAGLSKLSGDRKRVLILYTGGTMGMMPGLEGSLEPTAGYLTREIMKAPELFRPEMPVFDIKEYDPLIDSSAMGPLHWIQIATDIEKSYFDYDGFVVIMGTDTMAYASSALSFMLENLGKTVVFTGSQIPFAEVYNDARRNLIVSLIFSVQDDFPEVCVCFNDRLLRANRTVKVDSVGLAAFDTPNFPPLATLGVYIMERKELARPPPKGAFRVHKKLTASIIVIKLVPGFDDECIACLVEHSKNLKAIVLEMYGAGNAPMGSKSEFITTLANAKAKGIVVVGCSQCLAGGVSLGSYALGLELKKAGVIGAGDMTTEACTTKLAYLFGRGATHETMAEMLKVNLRGEISDKSCEQVKNKYLSGKRGGEMGYDSMRFIKQMRPDMKL